MNRIITIALSFLLLHLMTKPIAYTYHSAKDFKEELINPSKPISLENGDNWSGLDDFDPQNVSIMSLNDWEDQEQVCT